MILLDSSVVVQYLRTQSPLIERVFAAGGVGISGVTRAEVLHGASNDADYQKLNAFLDQFIAVPIPESAWERLGNNLYHLRSQGISVPFPDALIATIAVMTAAQVWTYDTHFRLMQPFLPALLLFAAPAP